MRALSPTLALLACSPTLFAADTPADIDDDDVIVVTATRSEQLIERVPASVEVIDQEDLRHRGHPIQPIDALDESPGVIVNRDGSLGSSTSLRIRGAKGDSTQFMYDGMPIADPIGIGGQINPSFLNPAGLANMELVKGPQSGLHGSRAVGGVVNLRRITASREHEGFARLEAGSFATLRSLAQATGPISERLGFAVGLSYEQSDSISQLTDDEDGDPSGFEDDAFERLGLYGRLDIAVAEGWNAFVNADILIGESDYDESFTGGDDDQSRFEYDHLAFQSGVDGELGAATGSSTRLSYTIYDRANPGTAYGSSDFATATFWGSQQFDHAIGERFELSGGVDYRHETGETTEVGGGEPVDADAGQLGIFAQGLWHEWLDGSVSGFEGQLNLRYDDHSEEHDAFTWRLGAAAFLLDDRVKLQAAYGTGFRAPTLYELFAPAIDFGFGPSPIGNDDVEAETSSGFEFGHVSELPQGFTLANTYFRTAYDQAIVFGLNGFENADSDEEIQGIESSLAWTGVEGRWHASLAHTWHDQVDGDELMRRLPEHSLDLALRWKPVSEAWVRAALAWRDERADSYYDPATFSTVDTTLDSHTQIDLSGGYTFHEQWTVHARIENLTDEHHQPIYGYASPGIGFYAGLTASY